MPIWTSFFFQRRIGFDLKNPPVMILIVYDKIYAKKRTKKNPAIKNEKVFLKISGNERSGSQSELVL